MSASRVTNSPRRLDIDATSPPETRCTNWSKTISSTSGSPPSAAYAAVVVGTQDVDQAVVAAAALVLVVGDVDGEVGRLAARADQHAVLVVAEGLGAQPACTLGAVEVPTLLQGGKRRLDRAVFAHGAL